jgi:glycosyltransferase involved in cell wall biosynthesis
MKLAFVTETFTPEVNGVALTVASLVRQCRRLGHEVELIRPRQNAVAQDSITRRLIVEHLMPSASIPFYAGLRFGFPARRKLLALWQQRRPDGVYIATEGPLGHSALNAAKQLGIPVLSGFHTRFDTYLQHYGFGILSGFAKTLMRRFHNRADAVLVPTPALQRELQGDGYQHVIRLERAVDTVRFDPSKQDAELRSQWRVGVHAPAILFVGRLAAEKNLALAVRSFRHISARFPGAKMIWVGDGPMRAGLEQQLRGDPAHIFCGVLHDEELARTYASTDVFVFPSLSETFGNVTLEALASGVPVCAFDYGAAQAFIQSPLSGRRIAVGCDTQFVESACALAQASVTQRREMRSGARAEVEHLNPERVAQSLVSIFQQLHRAASGNPSPANAHTAIYE